MLLLILDVRWFRRCRVFLVICYVGLLLNLGDICDKFFGRGVVLCHFYADLCFYCWTYVCFVNLRLSWVRIALHLRCLCFSDLWLMIDGGVWASRNGAPDRGVQALDAGGQSWVAMVAELTVSLTTFMTIIWVLWNSFLSWGSVAGPAFLRIVKCMIMINVVLVVSYLQDTRRLRLQLLHQLLAELVKSYKVILNLLHVAVCLSVVLVLSLLRSMMLVVL